MATLFERLLLSCGCGGCGGGDMCALSACIDLSKRRVTPDDRVKCEERYAKATLVSWCARHHRFVCAPVCVLP
jgi:hypothetical protein